MIGDAPRFPYGLRGPDNYRLNMALRRTFPISERFKFIFGVDGSNLTNHTTFGNNAGNNQINVNVNSASLRHPELRQRGLPRLPVLGPHSVLSQLTRQTPAGAPVLRRARFRLEGRSDDRWSRFATRKWERISVAQRSPDCVRSQE